MWNDLLNLRNIYIVIYRNEQCKESTCRNDNWKAPSNHISVALSRDFQKSWPELFELLSPYLPEEIVYQVWQPEGEFILAVLAAL